MEGRCKLVIRAEGLQLIEGCKHLEGQYRDWTKEKQQTRQLSKAEARGWVRQRYLISIPKLRPKKRLVLTCGPRAIKGIDRHGKQSRE